MSERARGWRAWERRPMAEPEPGEEAPPVEPQRTFIDPGAIFEGNLRLREDLRIDCEFKGSIETAGCLVVGETGTIEGDIHAREVEIRGAVVGNVFARRQISVRAGARLHGDIESACVEIEKHAFFNGRTSMARPEVVLREQAAAREAEPAAAPGLIPATASPAV